MEPAGWSRGLREQAQEGLQWFTCFILPSLHHTSPRISWPLGLIGISRPHPLDLTTRPLLWSRTYPTVAAEGSLLMTPSRESLTCCGQSLGSLKSVKTLQLPLCTETYLCRDRDPIHSLFAVGAVSVETIWARTKSSCRSLTDCYSSVCPQLFLLPSHFATLFLLP